MPAGAQGIPGGSRGGYLWELPGHPGSRERARRCGSLAGEVGKDREVLGVQEHGYWRKGKPRKNKIGVLGRRAVRASGVPASL